MANWNDEMDVLNLEDLLREEDGPAGSLAPAADGPEAAALSQAEDEQEAADLSRAGDEPGTADLLDSGAAPGPAVSSESGVSSSSQRTVPSSSGSGERRARRTEPGIGDTSALHLEFIDLEGIPEDSDGEGDFGAAEPDGGDFYRDSARERSPKRGREQDRDRKKGRNGRNSGGNSAREREREWSGGIPIHLILPVIIVIVAAVAVIRFVIWNAGVDPDIDAESNANRFNVEVNDSMASVSSSDLEGGVSDDITTVLCLGNEPFSLDTSDSGLAAQIASLGDCEVINAAFPDSQVTCENETYTTDTLEDMDDIFNLFYVAYAISIGDYTSLETVASVHEETYQNAVAALQSTDFGAVDILAIMYDGIDYVNGMAMYNEEVPEELTTYVGSLYNSIVLLREAYPHIRIVFLSPYYAEYDSGSARTTDLGNGTLVDYFQWAYDTCGSEGISFLDNYYGSINENNFEEYLDSDMTLNADGAVKIADHFVYKVIQGNYSEYNVEELAVAQ